MVTIEKSACIVEEMQMRATPSTTTSIESPAFPAIIHATTSECIVLCAEPGMGKSTCLTHAVSYWLQRGNNARYIDVKGLTTAEVVQELKKQVRRRTVQNDEGSSNMSLLALDNLVVEDESDADAIASLIQRLMSAQVTVALAIMPEYEFLAEMIGATHCFWSCDLRLPRPDGEREASDYDLYANGVPCMVSALQKAISNGTSVVTTDASYQEPYVNMVSSCVRSGMMKEEKQLRIAMLLLGCGTKHELEHFLGAVDNDLWLSLVRDVPFLGADAAYGTFRCVGSHSLDCLHLAYSALYSLTQEWSWLVSGAARTLILRKEYSRAAMVGSMCSDADERHALLLEFGPQMINAGEIAVLIDAMDETRECGQTYMMGFDETSCVLSALGERGYANVRYVRPNLPASPASKFALLAWQCRELHRGRGFGQTEVPEASESLELDITMSALVVHEHMLEHLAVARVDLAYEELLGDSARLEEASVASAIGQMDYMLCSLLVGVAPSMLDQETMEDHLRFLERSGLVSLGVAYDAVLLSSALLAGRMAFRDGLEAHIQRAERAGDAFIRGLLLVVASVSDLRIGALTRGHVRLTQAIKAFAGMECPALAKTATLLDLALRSELGERVLRTEIQACRGVSEHLDQVIAIFCMALSTAKPASLAGETRWGALECPRDVLWLVNVMMNDFGSVSERFLNAMPAPWRDSVMRATAEVDGFLQDVCGQWSKADTTSASKARKAAGVVESLHAKPVRLSMLGGFEVLVEGLPVSGSRLERRRAKALLALLSAVPGHRAKRFVIMESIWPTHDYESANKCLYSATSVLRTEIGLLLGDDQGQSVIITNKAEGTISLDATVVDCDIDAFERTAHELLDVEGDDRLVVTSCRHVEELYRGDLFVPPTDGVGVVETRARELRALFSDAMIAGASAAGRLGMKSLACRFAKKAHNADNMREDAMKVLAIALCAAGRHAEAERCYEQFVGRVVDMTKRPPSRQLRQAVEELLSGKVQKRLDGRRGDASGGQKGQSALFGDAGTEQMSFAFESEA